MITSSVADLVCDDVDRQTDQTDDHDRNDGFADEGRKGSHDAGDDLFHVNHASSLPSCVDHRAGLVSRQLRLGRIGIACVDGSLVWGISLFRISGSIGYWC